MRAVTSDPFTTNDLTLVPRCCINLIRSENDDEEKHKNLAKLLEHLDDSDKEKLLKLLRKR